MSTANQAIERQRRQTPEGSMDLLMILDDVLAGFKRHFPLIILLASLMASIVFFTV